jgi:hypothetical protein
VKWTRVPAGTRPGSMITEARCLRSSWFQMEWTLFDICISLRGGAMRCVALRGGAARGGALAKLWAGYPSPADWSLASGTYPE